METKQIEIKDFTLTYDGIYEIQFANGKHLKAVLTLDVLLKMLQIEGYSNEEIIRIYRENMCHKLAFKKVTLLANYIKHDDGTGGYETSVLAEMIMDHGIYPIEFSIKE